MRYVLSAPSRLAMVKSYRALTSSWLQLVLYVSLILSVLAWSTLVFFGVKQLILALAIITTAVALGCLNGWVFAKTYYPYLLVPEAVSAVNKGVVDVGKAQEFDLLLMVGFLTANKSTKNLAALGRKVIVSEAARPVLKRLQINKTKLVEMYEKVILPRLTWSDLAEGMYRVAVKLKQEQVVLEHVIGAILTRPEMRKFIRLADLTEKDILFTVWWQTEQRRLSIDNKRWWDERKMLAFSGVGLSWASGFTPFVDRFARLPRGNSWDNVLYGHEQKVEELINTLARQRQNNVLLVGDPGVGRLGIIRQLTWLIRTSQAHEVLVGQRVLYINAGELVAQGSTGASQLSLITRALNEMERAGNIIAIIDGLGTILGETGEQRVNLTDILLPFLSSPNVRVVVISAMDDYHLRLKSNEEIIQYFEVVQVPSLSVEGTMKRLALTLPQIEREAKLFVPYKTVKTLAQDTAAIMPHIPFPERAYDFLEEAIVLAQGEKSKILEPRHVQEIVSRKIGINLGKMKARERQRLLSLTKVMHRRLVNQNRAVVTLTRALVRARAQVRSSKRPIGTFLFLGPTGVGKTETAKTLAQSYFGSEDHMIRLDMSEFQGSEGVARLIGSSNQPTGRLTSLIADHPFSVLLLDEFEKASEQAHQLFLQVFDEGRLTDVAGRIFSFRHAIIIATSNAGAELIRQSVKDGTVPAGFEETLKEYILRHNLLRPELLNRFDAVVMYTPLSKEHINQIARLMLRSLNKRLDERHGVKIKITDALVNYLVTVGYDPEFGARPMNRAIQDTVEYYIARKIVRGEMVPGQELEVDPRVFSFNK